MITTGLFTSFLLPDYWNIRLYTTPNLYYIKIFWMFLVTYLLVSEVVFFAFYYQTIVVIALKKSPVLKISVERQNVPFNFLMKVQYGYCIFFELSIGPIQVSQQFRMRWKSPLKLLWDDQRCPKTSEQINIFLGQLRINQTGFQSREKISVWDTNNRIEKYSIVGCRWIYNVKKTHD